MVLLVMILLLFHFIFFIFFLIMMMLVDRTALTEWIPTCAHHSGWMMLVMGYWMAIGVKGGVHVGWGWGIEGSSGWVMVMAMVVHVWMSEHHGRWVWVVWVRLPWVASLHVGEMMMAIRRREMMGVVLWLATAMGPWWLAMICCWS